MPINTKLAVSASLGALTVALLYPRFILLRLVLLIPLRISLIIAILLASLIWSLIRLDRISKPIPSISTRQRHALRPLTFTSPSAWSAVLTRHSWEDSPAPTSFAPIHRSALPKVNARVDHVFNLIKDTFILPWYSRISPSRAFPDAVEILVRRVLGDVIPRAEKVDWSILLIGRIIPLVQDHLHHYRSVEYLTLSSGSATSTAALPLPLPAKAHPALSQQAHLPIGTFSPSIEAYLRGWLGRILGEAIPENDRSEVVKTLAREIILGAALIPTFEMMCDSDFWNRQIDEQGGRYLHEQYVPTKFLQNNLTAL